MATILNAFISQSTVSKPSLCLQFRNRNLNHNHISLPSKLSFKSVNITHRNHMNPSSIKIKCSIIDKTIESLRASRRETDADDLMRMTDTGPGLLNMVYGRNNILPGAWKKDSVVLPKLQDLILALLKEERYQDALEVYQAINNWKERDEMTTKDAATQVYLVARVHGVPSAEKYFSELPDAMKDERTYSALLIRYMVAGMKTNVESLFHEMRNRGYASDEESFYRMLKFHKDLKDYDKVELTISKLMEENIPLDSRSYYVWLWSCQSQESLDKIFKQALLDPTYRSPSGLFSTIAIMYNELGLHEKVQDCVNEIERIITLENEDYTYPISLCCLMSLCCRLRNRRELNRVWETYKSILSKDSSEGYMKIIDCLFTMDDVEDGEKMYEEWFSRPHDSDSDSDTDFDWDCDSEIYKYYKLKRTVEFKDSCKRDHLLACYARKGLFKEAEAFFDETNAAGIKSNPFTWQILAAIQIKRRNISKALSFLRKAFSFKDFGNRIPNNVTVCSFLKICEEEADMASKDALFEIFKEARIKEGDVAYLVEPDPYLNGFDLFDCRLV